MKVRSGMTATGEVFVLAREVVGMTALGIALLTALLVFHGRLSSKGSTAAETAGTRAGRTVAAGTRTARTTSAVAITAVAFATIGRTRTTGTAAHFATIAVTTTVAVAITAITAGTAFRRSSRTHDAGLRGFRTGDDAHAGSGSRFRRLAGFIAFGLFAVAFLHRRQEAGLGRAFGIGRKGSGSTTGAISLGSFGLRSLSLRGFDYDSGLDFGGRSSRSGLNRFLLDHSSGSFRLRSFNLGSLDFRSLGLGGFDHNSGLDFGGRSRRSRSRNDHSSLSGSGGHDLGGRGLYHAGAAGLFSLFGLLGLGSGLTGGLGHLAGLGSLFGGFGLGFHRGGRGHGGSLGFDGGSSSGLFLNRRLGGGRGRGRLGTTTYDDVLAYVFADNFHRGLRLLDLFEFFRGDGTLDRLLETKLSQADHQFGGLHPQFGGGISDLNLFHSFSPYEICA